MLPEQRRMLLVVAAGTAFVAALIYIRHRSVRSSTVQTTSKGQKDSITRVSVKTVAPPRPAPMTTEALRTGRVVIVGGGISGLSTALALQRSGLDAQVYERYGHLQGRATGFSIWAYAIKRLIEWGFNDERLHAIGREIQETHIVDDRNNLLLVMPIHEASMEVQAPSFDVDRRKLQEQMIELLGPQNYHYHSEVVGVEENELEATITLANGSRVTGDLVVGCDGIHSMVRDSYLQQRIELANGETDVIQGIAPRTKYLSKGHHVQVWGSRARFGVGWIDDERVRWFIGGNGIALKNEPPISKAELLQKVENLGLPAVVKATIEATDEDQIFRVQHHHGYPPKKWHSDRVVLLGDSCHTMSPFAGMGACAAIEDASHFTRILLEASSVPDALAAFQESRQGDVVEIERKARHNERMMHPSNSLVYWVRNKIFRHTSGLGARLAKQMTSGQD